MEKKYDLIVAGGGMSGVAAAVAAAREGLKVLLVEKSGMLGGMGTSGLITMMMTSRSWFYGIGKNLINKMIANGGARYVEKPPVKGYDYYPFDGESMKRELDLLAEESGVQVLLYTQVIGVVKQGDKITEIELSGIEGNFSVSAGLFVDATGDACLCRFAGEKVAYGDINCQIQAPTPTAYYAGIDFEKYENYVASFDDGTTVPKIKMMHTLIPKAYENGDLSMCDLHHPGVFRISEAADVGLMNVGHIYGADCSTSAGMTAATVKGRKMAKEYLDFYKKYIPGFENAYLTNTGNSLSLRETFRLEGRYITTFNDKAEYKKFSDAIMRFDGGAVSDLHASSADKDAYGNYVKLFSERESVKRDDYATLPYRSLQCKETENLLAVGRCVSADRETLGQIRLMSYCAMMGQAAGLAAAVAVDKKQNSFDIKVALLQEKLKLQGVETL